MQRAQEAGYRAGWRGAVAYAASPWLWRTGSFVTLVVASATASCWLLYSSISMATPASAKVFSAILGVVVLGLLVVGPLFRVWRRRSSLDRPAAT